MRGPTASDVQLLKLTAAEPALLHPASRPWVRGEANQPKSPLQLGSSSGRTGLGSVLVKR